MSNNTKIAIIDDEPAITNMYKMRLETAGYEVRTALNGKEGLELIREFQPTLVLLDLRMPVMGGDEMLEKLRAIDWGSKIRVIILTNISKDEAPANLRFLNVDRYIVKAHHTPHQITEIINEVLGKRLPKTRDKG
jgi:DNA-binding response OmpR family regulator